MSYSSSGPIKNVELHGIKKLNSGKVREIFDVENYLLLVATDRLSAFDVILPDPIPQKGCVLTQLSAFWFGLLQDVVDNHLISVQFSDFPSSLSSYRDQLSGRSTLARKCRPLPIECVVRGYMAGSGWKEYQQNQMICGIKLPSGLRESDKLPEPIFTPATKAVDGHDENISFDKTLEIIGADLAEQTRDFSLRLYNRAQKYAAEKGIIICDTKFEFGLDGSKLLLIDEILTPDSSRFWPADEYRPGRSQPSFDKQFIRDFLETLDWDKTPPGPTLPESIIEATTGRYLEAYSRLTGTHLKENK